MTGFDFDTPASRSLIESSQNSLPDMDSTDKIIEALFRKWTYLDMPFVAL